VDSAGRTAGDIWTDITNSRPESELSLPVCPVYQFCFSFSLILFSSSLSLTLNDIEGQRAVMLCDWGVKADMVLFAGNTV